MSLTIKDIAELANVSRGTVDRVLNNREGVSPETRRKIHEIIERSGFTPNIAGKILANKKKSLVLGAVLPSIGNDFFIDVIEGVKKAVEELSDFGVEVIIKEIEGYNAALELDTIALLSNVNGLVIAPTNDIKLADNLSKLKIPIVTINTDIENSGRICYIGHESKKSGITAAGLMNLFSNGTANIGVVTGFHSVLGHKHRIDGFSESIKENFPNIKIIDTIESHDNSETAFSETKKMLINHPKINAIYVTAGGVNGVCKAVKELCGDVILITHDDIFDTKKFILDGTIKASLCQDPVRQGYLSVKILFDYLVGGKLPENEYEYTDVIIKIKENL